MTKFKLIHKLNYSLSLYKQCKLLLWLLNNGFENFTLFVRFVHTRLIVPIMFTPRLLHVRLLI